MGSKSPGLDYRKLVKLSKAQKPEVDSLDKLNGAKIEKNHRPVKKIFELGQGPPKKEAKLSPICLDPGSNKTARAQDGLKKFGLVPALGRK